MMPFLHGADAEAGAPLDRSIVGGSIRISRDRTAERGAEVRRAGVADRAALAMRRSGTVGGYDIGMAARLIVADETAARMHPVDAGIAGGGTSGEAFFRSIVGDDRKAARASTPRSPTAAT